MWWINQELLPLIRTKGAKLTEAESQRIIARLSGLTRFKRTPEQLTLRKSKLSAALKRRAKEQEAEADGAPPPRKKARRQPKGGKKWIAAGA